VVSIGAVDGLISGMNTSQVIAQLMQIEATPQTNLKNQVSKQNLIISAYQAVNSRMAALKNAAEAFTPPNSLTPTNPTWQAVKATSSSSSVTATATAGATAGSLTFNVKSLAKAQVTTTATFDSSSSTAATASTVDFMIGGTLKQVDVTADKSVQGVAKAINGAKIGVTASVITVSDPSDPSGTGTKTVLQLTGNSTGKANSFTVSGLSASTTDIASADDAKITVGTGDPATGGYTVTSPTNTFGNFISNVTLTVSKAEDGVTVNVTSDQDPIADKMQALIDAANGALAQIGTYSSYNKDTKAGGALTGDFTVRQLRDNILSSISNGMSGYGSYKQLGVQLDKSGKLTFDRNAFLVALNTDPSAVQNAVAGGLAKGLDTIAIAATDFVSGSLTTAIQAGNAQVKDLNDRISDWDVRLETRKTMLKRQFASMEAALGTLKNQSSWLAGQIAGLPRTGTGN
jgi:flagellar hook-associated protein 2